mmetsp:Transcript_21788/g.20916  ORF Transcript_21788/g.20916 Transcript_21788/m.20916 type:complete len:309 (-) Transcript_21788:365-1291(-)
MISFQQLPHLIEEGPLSGVRVSSPITHEAHCHHNALQVQIVEGLLLFLGSAFFLAGDLLDAPFELLVELLNDVFHAFGAHSLLLHLLSSILFFMEELGLALESVFIEELLDRLLPDKLLGDLCDLGLEHLGGVLRILRSARHSPTFVLDGVALFAFRVVVLSVFRVHAAGLPVKDLDGFLVDIGGLHRLGDHGLLSFHDPFLGLLPLELIVLALVLQELVQLPRIFSPLLFGAESRSEVALFELPLLQALLHELDLLPLLVLEGLDPALDLLHVQGRVMLHLHQLLGWHQHLPPIFLPQLLRQLLVCY